MTRRVTIALGAKLLVCATLFTIAGASGGYLVARSHTPDLLGPDADGLSKFPVVVDDFYDTREVNVSLTAATPLPLEVHRAGILTSTNCQHDQPVQSGSSLVSIDGSPVISLSTTVPFYRDMTTGLKGSDVAALQTELNRLGHSVTADGTYGRQTASAVAALRRLNGLAAGSDLPLADVLWLPRDELTVQDCALLGSTIAPGDRVALSAPQLVAARIDPLPSGLVEGDRVLALDQLTVHIDAEGGVDRDSLESLSAEAQVASAIASSSASGPAQVTGSLRLRSPLEVATIPAAAIVIDSRATCVVSEGQAVPVTVVASQLGQSLITFQPDMAVPEQIDADPDGSQLCS